MSALECERDLEGRTPSTRRYAVETRLPKSPGLRKSKAFEDMVGAAGFEPATSRTRTVRSTGLSHAPL